MQRFILQSAIVSRYGLYQYQRLSLEQARLWLSAGPDPLFRLPLIGSVIQALTGRSASARPGERFILHVEDEALIMSFQFPEDAGRPGFRRGHIATQPRPLSLAEVQECVQFALLTKFARLDSYVQSIVQWDPAHVSGGSRYLVHDALLTRFGIYEYASCGLDTAISWLDEGTYESQLRYDATCKALELVSDRAVTMWETNSHAILSLQPGDQALLAYYHLPGGEKPKPFEVYSGELSPTHIQRHLTLGFLTRLSDEFVERNRDVFPLATKVPEKQLRS